MTAVLFAVGASFLASCVEFVEAFTVILAVGISRNWRSSLLGAAAASVFLALIVAAFGLTLASTIPLPVLRGVIGTLVLIFGLKWLRKAILRYAGIKGLHDEAEIFAEQCAELRTAGQAPPFDWLGFAISTKSTLLEGLEVAFIVITFGLSSGRMELSVLGAVCAFIVVAIAGFFVRKPLEQVPENTMKFVVGVMLTTFGTFWAGEGLGVGWPGDDLAIIPLIGLYLLFSWLAIRWLAASSALQTTGPDGEQLATAS
jgi:uncharacterized membrane protein